MIDRQTAAKVLLRGSAWPRGGGCTSRGAPRPPLRALARWRSANDGAARVGQHALRGGQAAHCSTSPWGRSSHWTRSARAPAGSRPPKSGVSASPAISAAGPRPALLSIRLAENENEAISAPAFTPVSPACSRADAPVHEAANLPACATFACSASAVIFRQRLYEDCCLQVAL